MDRTGWTREQYKEYIKQLRVEVKKTNNNEYNKEYLKRRRRSDLLFKLKKDIGATISGGLGKNGYGKSKKTEAILGCSFEEFKVYLESKFEPWMNWENKGSRVVEGLNQTWDIDHIIPISSAQTEEDIIRLNHYTNLQPLCSYINRYVKRDNPEYV
jgi:hypothetical protein